MLARTDNQKGLVSAVRFIRYHGLRNLCVIEEDGHIKGFTLRPNTVDDTVLEWLERHDGRRNLYIHVNPLLRAPQRGKATKADVAALRYMGADIDPPADFPWADETHHHHWIAAETRRLQGLDRPPSFINCSGWGVQAFWRLSEDVPSTNEKFFIEAEKRNQYHAKQLGGDKGVFSSDRLWRLPGTTNVPTVKKKAQGRRSKVAYIAQWDNGRRYPLEDFPLPPTPTIATTTTIARPPAETPRHLEDRMRASEVGHRSEDFHAAVCGLADRGFSLDQIEAELQKHPNGPAAKYAGRLREEIQRSLTKWTPKPQCSEQAGQSPGIGHNEPPGEPTPLFRAIPAATAFPVDAMGLVMANATMAFHEEIQAPLALCGNSVLASATLAVQQAFDVQLPHGGRSPTSSYFATVGRSGERKSAVDAKALRPVREYEQELRSDYDSERRQYLDHKDVWDAARKKTIGSSKLDLAEKRQELKNLGPEPQPPLKPIRAVSDVTAEGLFNMLEYVLSAGVFASEGGQFTGGHVMSDDAKLRSAAFFSLMWDRGSGDRVRAREEPKVLNGRRLSVHLFVQPDVAFRFVSDPVLRDQGLLSRFLIAFPDSRMGERKFVRELGLDHVTAQVRFGARLKELLARPLPTRDDDSCSLVPAVLQLTEAATELFIAFVNEIEAQLGPGGHLVHISGLANKLPEHAARLAAVRAIIEDPAAEEIDEAAMRGGIQLARYYASEAQRLAMMSREQIELQEAHALWEWLSQKWVSHHGIFISVTDLLQRGPNFVRDKKKVEETIAILENHGHLKRVGPQVIEGKMRRETWQLWRAEC